MADETKRKRQQLIPKQEVNGYKNYMTWLLHLEVVNDLSMYLMLLMLGNECKSHEELAEKGKELILQNNPLKDQHNVYARILRDALNDVDWMQIVEFVWEHPIENHVADNNVDTDGEDA